MGFADFLAQVGDDVYDLGIDYAQAKMKQDTAIRAETAPGGEAVRQGEKAPVAVPLPATAGLDAIPGTFDFFGMPVDKRLALASGAVLGVVVLIKLLK